MPRETWTVTRDGVKEVMGYRPPYVRGTTGVADARRVTVRVAEEASNTDFALAPGRAARVSGTAVDSHGRPFQTVSVSQEVRGDGFGSFGSIASSAVHPDGTFTIVSVPPGDYVLGTSTGRDSADPQVAMMPVTVD